ncbi:MAG: DUF6760 family protein [Synechococcales bacterium]|nr:DUF6760 family protein [Synechococcales bacterium]
MLGYPLAQLHEEVACLALHFHWSLDDILRLEHADRRRWVLEIQKALPTTSQSLASGSLTSESSTEVESELWFTPPYLSPL